VITETQFLARCERLGIDLNPRQYYMGKVVPRKLAREELKSLGFIAASEDMET
jgi:hypothetical protein